MKEGFAISAGLILIGLFLEAGFGPVLWEALIWPVNIIALTAFLLVILVAFMLRKNSYTIPFLTTHRAALPALVFAVVLTIVMGTTRQQEGGSWFHDMLTFWPFVLIYAYIAFLLGILTLRRIDHMVNFKRRHRHQHQGHWLRDIAFLLNHGGLFLTLVTATLGNPDIQRLRMVAYVNKPEVRAINEDQRVVQLPISIELKRFILEEYDDGTPRRFASEINIETQNRKSYPATVDVNHPVNINGWKVYQYGYDIPAGAQSQYSVFELISDPWQPYVHASIFMMLAGALLLFFSKSYTSDGLSEEDIKRQRKAQLAKRAKEESKRRMAEEFYSISDKTDARHHHHEHHHTEH
jgi:hypothetical protein